MAFNFPRKVPPRKRRLQTGERNAHTLPRSALPHQWLGQHNASVGPIMRRNCSTTNMLPSVAASNVHLVAWRTGAPCWRTSRSMTSPFRAESLYQHASLRTSPTRRVHNRNPACARFDKMTRGPNFIHRHEFVPWLNRQHDVAAPHLWTVGTFLPLIQSMWQWRRWAWGIFRAGEGGDNDWRWWHHQIITRADVRADWNCSPGRWTCLSTTYLQGIH